jgi:Raf kinase inhibitor-like YbhB/YbcL family protein
MVWRLAVVLVALAVVGAACSDSGNGGGASKPASPVTPQTEPEPAVHMRLTSSAFAEGAAIPARFTCDGPGDSPPLAWANVPGGTSTLALRMQDVDTPRKFVHWIVYNIKPQTTSIAAAQAPPGAIQASNTFKRQGYSPPCPPIGQRHRYVFTLLSLATQLTVSSDVDAEELWATLERSSVTAKGELTGTYQRGG